MNLPKYTPGIVVMYQSTLDEGPDQFGMFAIASAFLADEQWHYSNHDSTTIMPEQSIYGIVTNGYFIPARRVSGVQEAPEYDPEAAGKDDLNLELSPEEQEFIKEHEGDRDKAKKAKKSGKQKRS